MSALAASLMEQLTRNFLWMRALATTPALDKEVRDRLGSAPGVSCQGRVDGRTLLIHTHIFLKNLTQNADQLSERIVAVAERLEHCACAGGHGHGGGAWRACVRFWQTCRVYTHEYVYPPTHPHTNPSIHAHTHSGRRLPVRRRGRRQQRWWQQQRCGGRGHGLLRCGGGRRCDCGRGCQGGLGAHQGDAQQVGCGVGMEWHGLWVRVFHHHSHRFLFLIPTPTHTAARLRWSSARASSRRSPSTSP